MAKIWSDKCLNCKSEGKVDGVICPRCLGSRREPEAVIGRAVVENPIVNMIFGTPQIVIPLD